MAELLQGIGPAAYVRNLAASRRFYEELLGLEIARVMSEDAKNIAVAYKAGLSIWQVDHAYDVIFDQSSPRPDKLGCGNWEFSFETPQLEALAVRLNQRGWDLPSPCASSLGASAQSASTIPTGISSTSALLIGA